MSPTLQGRHVHPCKISIWAFGAFSSAVSLSLLQCLQKDLEAAINYLSSELLADSHFIMEAVLHDVGILQFASAELQSDRDVVTRRLPTNCNNLDMVLEGTPHLAPSQVGSIPFLSKLYTHEQKLLERCKGVQLQFSVVFKLNLHDTCSFLVLFHNTRYMYRK